MKNKRIVPWTHKFAFLFFFLILISICFLGCERKAEEKIHREEFVLGTFVEIQLFRKDQEPLLEKAFQRLRAIENDMSVNIPSSQVSRINQQAGVSPVAIAEDVYYVIERSLYFSKLSKGYFDITVEPLVLLWGIGTEHPKVPLPHELENALQKVGYQKIHLDPEKRTVFLPEKGMSIDLGGIAKGYAADEIVQLFKKAGVEKAMINLGGNIFALGEKAPETPWNIGIQDPWRERNQPIGSIRLANKTVVTSGIYERFFEDPVTKKHYHHILDPFTGYPADNSLASVTIISDSSIDADALSTSTFALGLEKGMKFAEGQSSIEAIFITKDKKVYLTPGLKESFKLLENDFSQAN